MFSIDPLVLVNRNELLCASIVVPYQLSFHCSGRRGRG
jgi:hypothetical protein